MKNLKPAQVIVETLDYERSHRKAPRGRGHWLFCTVRPGSVGYLDKLVPSDRLVDNSYSAQKRAAQVWAAAQGIPVIHVCD